MKMLRLAGLLVILLAIASGFSGTARATAPITCWKYCDNHYYSGQCWTNLAQCCQFNQNCPDPYTWIDGNCTDGENYCP
jgi:hypothetical protein